MLVLLALDFDACCMASLAAMLYGMDVANRALVARDRALPRPCKANTNACLHASRVQRFSPRPKSRLGSGTIAQDHRFVLVLVQPRAWRRRSIHFAHTPTVPALRALKSGAIKPSRTSARRLRPGTDSLGKDISAARACRASSPCAGRTPAAIDLTGNEDQPR